MVKIRHLKKAPITEALIDIRVNLPPQFDTHRFCTIPDELRKQYPKQKARRLFTRSVRLSDGGPEIEPSDEQIQGYIFKSEDERDVVQFRQDGFTLSRLSPYTDWESVYNNAHELWSRYLLLATPEIINRIAVRYINKIKIPYPIDDLDEYFTEPPRIPKSLPQEAIEFFSSILLPQNDLMANIIFASQPQHETGFAEILLDIDAYKVTPSGIEESQIWPELLRLRELKNRIFFGYLTEKSVSLFE